MKQILIIVSLCMTIAFNASAQEVVLKEPYVLINGKQVFKFEKINAYQYSFFNLDDDEFLMYKYSENETPSYTDDDFFVLNFLTLKVKVEISDFSNIIQGTGWNMNKNMAKLMTWLLKEKVLDAEGNLNSAKVEIFSDKYHEKILDRTVR
jgi:hypothetical protein